MTVIAMGGIFRYVVLLSLYHLTPLRHRSVRRQLRLLFSRYEIAQASSRPI